MEKEAQRDWERIKLDLFKFESKVAQYLKERGVDKWPNNGPIFPASYDVADREAFYKRWSFDGWAGSSGDDSVYVNSTCSRLTCFFVQNYSVRRFDGCGR